MSQARPDLSSFTTLVPRRSLFRQALLATLAFLGPVLLVLYWVTIPDGPWIVVLVTHILASLAFTVASWAFFATGVWVSPTGIAERGFFGRRTYFGIDEVTTVMLLRTFHGGDVRETGQQLFICGADDTPLVRLRGQFWSDESMDAVIEILDVPVTEFTESVTSEDLRAQYPGLLYWFEGRPVLAAAAFSAAVVCGGALIYAVVIWLGLPVSA